MAHDADAGIRRISTGITGLDDVLDGGLIADQSYLVRGPPGTGKTTLGLHFLTEGASDGEQTLFVNLGESDTTIRRAADVYGFDLDSVEFLDMSPTSAVFTEDQSYDIFAPSEVEKEPLTDTITETVENLQPDRIFVDSISQFRYLTPDDYQFHKQILSFVKFCTEQNATVLLTSQATNTQPDDDLQFLTDGIIHLDATEDGRSVTVTKYRGSGFRDGSHSLNITDEGIEVYPTLRQGERDRAYSTETISSGVPEIDQLLHGGIERGTLTLLSGPSGAGKTTLGTQFMKEAASRGERSVLYMFDEAVETFTARNEQINIPVEEMAAENQLTVEEIEALRMSADEFAHHVRTEVEEEGTDIVMIDGIDGYQLSIRGGDLLHKLHSLCRYLQNRGVTVILVTETGDVASDFEITEIGGSYLADNIVFLRHLEIEGELRKAIGVLKKRMSDYERTLREVEITERGLEVGEPLDNLRGIMAGTPELIDADAKASSDES